MIEDIEDEELLEEIRKDEADSKDFKSVINRKKVSKWDMDEAFASEA
ncbi:hypothetical protein JXB28_04920 [Candidatus Woesearchaeota archaeon]|nr:hypothetical protein [Candidatus Woesearchaeota archaeon]